MPIPVAILAQLPAPEAEGPILGRAHLLQQQDRRLVVQRCQRLDPANRKVRQRRHGLGQLFDYAFNVGIELNERSTRHLCKGRKLRAAAMGR